MEAGIRASDVPRAHAAAWIRTAYLGYFTIGMLSTVFGPLLVGVRDQLGLTHAQAGLLITAQFLASIVGLLVGGPAADRAGKRRVLAWAALLLLAGAAGVGAAARFGLLLAAFAVLGAGFGAMDGTGNALVSDLAPSGRAAALNRLNVIFSTGALAAPFLVARLFSAGLAGPAARASAYGVTALLSLLFLARSLVHGPLPGEPSLRHGPGGRRTPPSPGRGPAGSDPAAGHPGWAGVAELLSDRALWLMGTILLAYVALEASVGNWWAAYLHEAVGADAATAGDVLTGFFVGVALGRLATSLVVERLGYVRTLLLEAAGAAALLPAALLARTPAGAASVALAGFFAAGLWGTTLALAAERHPGRSGTISGLLMAMAALGSSLFPLWIGFLGDRVGLRAGFLTLEGVLLLMVALVGLLARELHGRPVGGRHRERA
ncbi:hypothetical protein LIP_2521 [Limnochorda pilosa]|uniref:Major facilitator superfamily (MFS) profile domain-containing protein n=1 Tax=Limnochorda pilosa TaxID=1555112 RepID=A0A0K2SMK9_LIMPI|nr:MFS transporter [Limnochorda pilosa]BAS28351.1 hypothetical protein LIP_2521 [Limnochorda pilosa]